MSPDNWDEFEARKRQAQGRDAPVKAVFIGPGLNTGPSLYALASTGKIADPSGLTMVARLASCDLSATNGDPVRERAFLEALKALCDAGKLPHTKGLVFAADVAKIRDRLTDLAKVGDALGVWISGHAPQAEEQVGAKPTRKRPVRGTPTPTEEVVRRLRPYILTIESKLSNAKSTPWLHLAKAPGRSGWYFDKLVAILIERGLLDRDYLTPGARKVPRLR